MILKMGVFLFYPYVDMKPKTSILIILFPLLLGIAQGEYRIGAGDVISISVWGHQELSVEKAAVTPDGVIVMPVIGQIAVSGKSPAELQLELVSILRKYIKGEPIVTVTISEFNSLRVSIFGAVKNPGNYAFPNPPNVLELIAKAGGLSDKAGRSNAKIVSANGSTREVDIDELIRSGGDIPVLSVGDTLVIPSVGSSVISESGDSERTEPIQITVVGEISSPGTYEFTSVPTLIEVLSRAGWRNDDQDSGLVKVVRTVAGRRESIDVDIAEFLRTGDKSIVPLLESGDMVIVEKQVASISVLGAVNNPGRYQIDRPITILEAIGIAGGISQKGDPKRVKIGRSKGSTYVWEEVDISGWLKGRRSPSEMPQIILPGELVIVPEGKVSFLEAAGSVRTIIGFLVDIIAIYGVYKLATQ